MAGFASDINAMTTQSAPVLLQQSLQAQFGSTVTVSNQGVNSTTLPMLLNGTDGKHPAWAQQMAASKAQIVYENFGLNDDYPGVGEPVDQFQAALVEFVSTARQAGKVVVLEEPNPSCDPARANLQAYVQAIDTVGAQMGVAVIHEWSYVQSEMPAWASHEHDCIHPDQDMYVLKAKLEDQVLSQIVASLMQ